jgi:hypothetical protein
MHSRNVDRGDVLSRPPYTALLGQVEASWELGQRSLSRAVLPDERHHLAGPNVQVDIDKTRCFAAWVGEVRSGTVKSPMWGGGSTVPTNCVEPGPSSMKLLRSRMNSALS